MPIRNLIVLAPSGLVLFEKEYSKEKLAQPRLLGSLLTAMTSSQPKPRRCGRPTSRCLLLLLLCVGKTA